jgi:hypothetical protein
MNRSVQTAHQLKSAKIIKPNNTKQLNPPKITITTIRMVMQIRAKIEDDLRNDKSKPSIEINPELTIISRCGRK